jgi:DOMON domain
MKMLLFNCITCLIGLLSCQNSPTILKNQMQMMNNQKPKQLEVNGMMVEWHHRNDRVFFTIAAPTEGWVTLGFNDKDDILHTNLIFCRVQLGKVEVADHYVLGFGDHQPTEKLGGVSNVKDISGEEKDGKTTASFSMPTKSLDKFHFNLDEGTPLWFICAFSAEDDFNHHSRMRAHRAVTL